MSKTASTELFQLIQSLNPTEKRYLKKWLSFSAATGKGKMIELFNLIVKQSRNSRDPSSSPQQIRPLADGGKEYNESQLKQQGNYSNQQIADLKRILYLNLLYGLDDYHAARTIAGQLRRLLSYIENLFQRGLYDQSQKILCKAKKLAYQYEEHIYLLEILNWERKLMRTKNLSGVNNEQLKNLKQEGTTIVKKYSSEYKYEWDYISLLNYHYRHVTERHPGKIKSLRQWKNNLYVGNKSKAASFKELLYHNSSNVIYYALKNEHEKGSHYLKKNLELFRSNPVQIQANEQIYLITLVNFCLTLLPAKQYDEVYENIQLIKQISPKTEHTSNLKFIWLCQIETDYYNVTGQFEKGAQLEYIAQLGSRKFENKIPNTKIFNLYYSLAYLFFGNENYSKALKAINLILNHLTSDNIQVDLQCRARLFAIIIHYELGNLDLLDYFIKSTHSFLLKNERLFEFEKTIIHFFRTKFLKINFQNKKKANMAFTALYNELGRMKKNPLEETAMAYVDYESWLESKIKNRLFGEIVREKAKK